MTDQTDTSTPRPAPSPVTNAEQIRWQRRAAIVLDRLLELAAKRDLPAITWTVSDAGASLAGECLARPHSERRPQIEAWRQALGEPDKFREVDLGGGVQVTAVWDGAAAKGANRPLLAVDGWQLASVVVYARILPDLDDEAAPLESAGLAQLAAYVDLAEG